jgi:hypothetical protein
VQWLSIATAVKVGFCALDVFRFDNEPRTAAIRVCDTDGRKVHIVAIELFECCVSLAMSASGKLHCSVASTRQRRLWAAPAGTTRAFI